MSGQIFISYRRDDSSAWAGRLYDSLSRNFVSNQIFIDVDNLDPGVDFVEAIEASVGSCDTLIAVIGKRWLISSDEEGKRRLDNPDDFVRLEISTALKRNIRVIPVLVDGASMPRLSDLPDELKLLVRRNALDISHTRFNADLGRLVATLERVLEKADAERKQRENDRVEVERLQREEKERLEAQRRKNEEKQRVETQLREDVERERLEANLRLKEDQERLEAERRQKEEQERHGQRDVTDRGLRRTAGAVLEPGTGKRELETQQPLADRCTGAEDRQSAVPGTLPSASPPPTVIVLSPKGGERWETETCHAISWKAIPGNNENKVKRIDLELFHDETMLESIAGEDTRLDGERQSFDWNLAGTLKPGDNYKIKVIAWDDRGQPGHSFSNGGFSVVPKSPPNDQAPGAIPGGKRAWWRGEAPGAILGENQPWWLYSNSTHRLLLILGLYHLLRGIWFIITTSN
jgi:hypothetical protein